MISVKALEGLEGNDFGLARQLFEGVDAARRAKATDRCAFTLSACLGRIKDGKPHDPYLEWHENGQKKIEGIAKDGVADLDLTSVNYWNSKGEEVDSWDEAQK